MKTIHFRFKFASSLLKVYKITEPVIYTVYQATELFSHVFEFRNQLWTDTTLSYRSNANDGPSILFLLILRVVLSLH